MAVDVREKPINIKDLVIPEPETVNSFDLDRLVEKAWPKIIRDVKEWKKIGRFNDYVYLAACASILKPDKKEELGLNRDVSKRLNTNVDTYANNDLFEYTRALFEARILFPDDDSVNKKLNENTRQRIEHTDFRFMEFASNCAIAGQMSPEYTEKIVEQLFFNYSLSMEESISSLACLRYASSIKIFDLQKFRGFKVKPDLLKQIEQDIEKATEANNMERFCQYALEYKVITAKNVSIGESGLELEMEESSFKADSIPQLPEVKKY